LGIYVNPDTNQFRAIDWRLFEPDTDGKTKVDHVEEMLKNAHHHKALSYRAVLMDTWYATKRLMLFIDKELNRIFYCPLKIKDFPGDYKVQLFRVPVSASRTDHVATNDRTCQSSEDVRTTCANRWKIEQLHREIKQLCGIEQCQCRKGRIQRNHIACAFLVWERLKQVACKTAQTVYQIKQNLLKDYPAKELKNPSVMFILA
jgi:hypothetical protein